MIIIAMKTFNGHKFLPVVLILSLIAIFFSTGLSAEDMDRSRALQSLIERARNREPKALYDLAVLYDTGYDSIPVDSVKSTALYRLSAELGYAPARNYLGFRYFNGEAVTQNVDSALYWITKAAAAGDLKAANNLGFLLANSDKVTHDYPQAVAWLSKAADAGLPSAQATLADLLRQGQGAPADTLMAVKLYTSAIKGGLRDAELKLLSMMGHDWESLPADSAVSLGKFYYANNAPFIAVTLFENAAAENNADALALLGDAYSRGDGLDYNHDVSLDYFLRAALLGQPSAQFVIGELLDIFPDSLSSAAPEATLAEFYGSQSEIPSEIYTASYWYEQAACQGVTDSETAAQLLSP